MGKVVNQKEKILITGAAGGLGRAFSMECARRNWDLVLTDSALMTESLKALAEGLKRQFAISVIWVSANLSENSERFDLINFIHAHCPDLTMLFNIAGIGGEGQFSRTSRVEVLSAVGVNVTSAIDLTHALLLSRDPDRLFRILTVSSLAAFYPMPAKALYAASKRLLLNFFRALREETRGNNVLITVLCPAGIPTNERVTASIRRQGIMGSLTARDMGFVARIAIDAALRGKFLVIPGVVNRFLRAVGGLLPDAAVTRLLWIRWKKRLNSHP